MAMLRYSPLILCGMIIGLAWGLSNNKTQQEAEAPVLSKCDSLYFANDSLVRRLEVANRRVQQYKLGLSFLHDKDKQAYDYVINAGNLNFASEW